MNTRQKLIANLAKDIIAQTKDGVFKVGIDGVDGAGKTYFGEELTEALKPYNISLIRSSTDFFHHPRKVRYRLGKDSPQGFFLDSFNYPKMKELLLDPISRGKGSLYYEQYFNHRTNQIEKSEAKKVEGKAILVFDGIFLHREELRDYWDFSIFLKVTRSESLRRCHIRDGSSPDINALKNQRYVLGQKLYLEQCQPMELATVVVNNEDLKEPFIVL